MRYAGRYELVDLLGEGGGGSVWRAWDHRRGRYVAAKLLRHRDSAALLRFVREQSVRVAHPHVAPPIGWAAEDDDVLLTMDLVAGGSVADLQADRGALPAAVAAVLAGQLLEALGAVHAAGVVHRDVKPSNLLLEATGEGRPFLRLADFGIAVVEGEPRLTQAGIVLGTPGYMPPEAMYGADAHPGQDLWSAGMVLRHLLTGVRPDDGDTVDPRRDPVPGGVPPALWDASARLAATRPEDRPSSAAAALDLLAGAVERAGLSAAVAAVGTPGLRPHVAVPDRLPPFPPGWVPAGPDGTPTAIGGDATIAVERPAPTVVVPSAPHPQATTVPTPASPVPPAAPPIAPHPPAADLPPAPRPAAVPERAQRRLALAAAGGALLLAGTLTALAVTLSGLGDDEPAGDAQARRTPPSTVAGGTPSTAPPAPATTTAAPTGTPASAAATGGAFPGEERLGEPCSFTKVGQFRTTPDGDIRCELDPSDGTYRWLLLRP